jgi:hypothetical protein
MREFRKRLVEAAYAQIDSECSYVGPLDDGQHVTLDGDINLHALVEAILTAMREPPGAMAISGGDVTDEDGDYCVGNIVSKNVWQAMIDEALKRPAPPYSCSWP